jgi:hypothetical protein
LLVSRKKKGISGVFVALIIFAMLFTVGANYFVYVNNTNLATYQASAARQDALLQARQEKLRVGVSLSGASTLVVSSTNIGGVTTSISSIYLTDTTGKMVNPPGIMGQASTNFSAAQWPLRLNVGAQSSAISGCVAGKTGCNIALSAYSYVSGNLLVNVVTGRGNIFSTSYPPVVTTGTGSNALVVTMSAYPTPPLTQVFTCTGCITLLVTVYNYASTAVSGVALSPNPPNAQLTGTATVTGGTCGLATPSSTIPGYSGSGAAPSITFTCTWNAQTGAVGGFASFSGYVQGTLSGVLISSALSISNIIQIGGTSNVTTQGAFSVNFFFFKSSACTNAPAGSPGSYSYASPCTTSPSPMPPASLGNLLGGATISAGSNYYVSFYVQITNNFPATLEILPYTFLQLDASHPPPVVGNETDFWLAGDVGTYNSTSHYYPNYCGSGGCAANKLPTLAAYTGNEVTCASTPTNCIEVGYGKTVTLTLAACGYGATNWDWGGTRYAKNFDKSTGCTSSAPAFSNLGSATILTLVVGFLYKGQIYTQAIQFQGLAVVP